MWNIQTFTSLPSTQTLAHERLSSGAANHGDVFVALHQTEGRGRYDDRTWRDEAGANLLMSVVLTEIPNHLHDKMQFIAALSVLAAVRSLLGREIREFASKRVQLKWTNDILLDGKKVSGVLSEAIWSGSTFKGVVLGIGININQEYFSEEITGKAIGLKQVLKFSIPLESIRDLMLASLEYTLQRYSSASMIMDDLRAELEWMRSINNFSLTEADGTKAEGLRYDGISNDGALRVITSEGNIQIYQNATLHIL